MAVALTDLQPPPPSADMSYEDVVARVNYLMGLWQPMAPSKGRIRNLMNGGLDAVRTLLGDTLDKVNDLTPIPPLIMSGITRLAQKVGGGIPDLKVPEYGYKKEGDASDTAKTNAELRERIVDGYDTSVRLDLQMAQVGRWLPGYGFAVWVITDGIDHDGSRYPKAELRDPFDCYPGTWSVNDQPNELAVVWRVPVHELTRLYPWLEAPGMLVGRETRSSRYPRTTGGAVDLAVVGNQGSQGWANQGGDGIMVAEYYCPDGTYMVLPEYEIGLEFIPNPIAPLNRFVVPKRLVFDRLVGAYDHIMGLASMIAKIDILQFIHMQDAVMTETNIFGESIDGKKYRRGRGAFNLFEQGARVEKPVANMPYQVFQLVDRMERRFRIGGSYPVTDDGEAPVQYLTGRGVDNLREDVDKEAREYQRVLRYALEDLDLRRLAWDEKRNGGTSRGIVGYRAGEQYSETYRPDRDIAGRWMTRRHYGVMAGWDEAQKIVTGLQLMSAGIIDRQTFQENLDNMEEITRTNQRTDRDQAEASLMAIIQQQAIDPNDPQKQARAELVLARIFDSPADKTKILREHFTPEDAPEDDQAYLEEAAPPMFEETPDITTALSRLEMGGGAEGGVQTVSPIAR